MTLRSCIIFSFDCLRVQMPTPFKLLNSSCKWHGKIYLTGDSVAYINQFEALSRYDRSRWGGNILTTLSSTELEPCSFSSSGCLLFFLFGGDITVAQSLKSLFGLHGRFGMTILLVLSGSCGQFSCFVYHREVVADQRDYRLVLFETHYPNTTMVFDIIFSLYYDSMAGSRSSWEPKENCPRYRCVQVSLHA